MALLFEYQGRSRGAVPSLPELPAACAPACAAAAAGAGLMNRTRAVLRPGLFPLPLSCLLPGCLAGFAHLTVPWRIKRYD